MPTNNTTNNTDHRELLVITTVTLGVWGAILTTAIAPYVAFTGFIQYIGIPFAIILAGIWWIYTFVYARILAHYLATAFTDS